MNCRMGGGRTQVGHMCTFMHVTVEVRSQPQVSLLRVHPPCFWRLCFSSTQSSQIPEFLLSLYILRTGIRGRTHHSKLLYRILGGDLRSPCLGNQHSTC